MACKKSSSYRRNNCWNLCPKDFCWNLIRPNKLDVIIFGASGYMGQRVVLEAATLLDSVTWGIAGRDRNKLEEVLLETSEQLDIELCDRPIFIANALDKNSLLNMVDRCRVLINCVAPYEIYGEAVVDACVEAGTHYVDLSIGPYFAELLQLQYHCAAKRENVYIVPSCGFHSLPYDIGVVYLQRHFCGVINSIEAYTDYYFENGSVEIPFAHGGLWTGIVMALSNMPNVRGLHNQLHRRELPELKPKLCYKPPHECKDIAPGTFLPLPVHSQVERTQYYFFEKQRKRPIQFLSYISLPSPFMAFVFMIWCFILGLLAQIKSVRVLLIQLPRIFTLGTFSGAGPDECMAQRLKFCITMVAKGWNAKRPCDQAEPNRSMKLTMCGQNPLYGVNCVCVLVSALALIKDPQHIPDRGGVYTPGVIFEHVHFLEEMRLPEHGLVTKVFHATQE